MELTIVAYTGENCGSAKRALKYVKRKCEKKQIECKIHEVMDLNNIESTIADIASSLPDSYMTSDKLIIVGGEEILSMAIASLKTMKIDIPVGFINCAYNVKLPKIFKVSRTPRNFMKELENNLNIHRLPVLKCEDLDNKILACTIKNAGFGFGSKLQSKVNKNSTVKYFILFFSLIVLVRLFGVLGFLILFLLWLIISSLISAASSKKFNVSITDQNHVTKNYNLVDLIGVPSIISRKDFDFSRNSSDLSNVDTDALLVSNNNIDVSIGDKLNIFNLAKIASQIKLGSHEFDSHSKLTKISSPEFFIKPSTPQPFNMGDMYFDEESEGVIVRADSQRFWI